jgi:hypothetical protein
MNNLDLEESLSEFSFTADILKSLNNKMHVGGIFLILLKQLIV